MAANIGGEKLGTQVVIIGAINEVNERVRRTVSLDVGIVGPTVLEGFYGERVRIGPGPLEDVHTGFIEYYVPGDESKRNTQVMEDLVSARQRVIVTRDSNGDIIKASVMRVSSPEEAGVRERRLV